MRAIDLRTCCQPKETYPVVAVRETLAKHASRTLCIVTLDLLPARREAVALHQEHIPKIMELCAALTPQLRCKPRTRRVILAEISLCDRLRHIESIPFISMLSLCAFLRNFNRHTLEEAHQRVVRVYAGDLQRVLGRRRSSHDMRVGNQCRRSWRLSTIRTRADPAHSTSGVAHRSCCTTKGHRGRWLSSLATDDPRGSTWTISWLRGFRQGPRKDSDKKFARFVAEAAKTV